MKIIRKNDGTTPGGWYPLRYNVGDKVREIEGEKILTVKKITPGIIICEYPGGVMGVPSHSLVRVPQGEL